MNSATVRVEQGWIQGREADSHGVVAFLGVPYGAAPVGRLRFEPPQTASAWKGVRQAHAFGPRSMQRAPFADTVFRSSSMNEDCLLLNVWTPEPDARAARLPILLYVHGGGFLVGDGSEPRHDGAALAARGIVVVTVNHRLGMFGFFAHPELPGANAGLFDLVAALHWVRTNAAAFGGDADKVTIGGSSSGGYAAWALACSPSHSSHICGAIVQSAALLGTALVGLGSELATLEQARERGRKYAVSLGASNVEALRAASAVNLLERSSVAGWNRPVIDEVLIQQDVHQAFTSASGARVPVLAGIASAERSFDLGHGRAPTSLDALWRRLRPDFGPRAEAVYAAYGCPKTATDIKIASRDLSSDLWTGVDTYRFCQATAAAGVPVYSYVFDHSRPVPDPGSGGWTCLDGAGHSTDIEYFLGTQELTNVYAWTQDDKQLSATMQAYVVNFVKTGNPNGATVPEWPRFGAGERIVLSVAGGTQSLRQTAALSDVLGRRS